jgi:hypothetical protein
VDSDLLECPLSGRYRGQSEPMPNSTESGRYSELVKNGRVPVLFRSFAGCLVDEILASGALALG